MGNCVFEIYYHTPKEGNKNFEQLKTSQENETYSIISVRIREKEDIIKNKLNDKIPELGEIIHLKQYEQLINESIRSYISKNKLNYKNYIPDNLITYFSFPIKFENNNIYYGNWNENIEMEGYGVYYINNQKVVTEGVWIKGNIIFGRIFFPNGDIYEGEMKNSVPYGKGKISFSNGESYKGDFILGEMIGKGTFIFSDKTIYKGGIKNGIFNDEGIMKWINGTEYHGNFEDSFLCGKGKIFNIQGEEYEGDFDKNEFNGHGIYLFNNGDEYEGNFEYGIKKGKGRYKRNDKITFEGFWNDDLPNGKGIISYKGNKINGYWRNGNLIGSPVIEKGDINIFNNIDLDIKPDKINIYPNSLPHLGTGDTSVSQFIPNNSFV